MSYRLHKFTAALPGNTTHFLQPTMSFSYLGNEFQNKNSEI